MESYGAKGAVTAAAECEVDSILAWLVAPHGGGAVGPGQEEGGVEVTEVAEVRHQVLHHQRAHPRL